MSAIATTNEVDDLIIGAGPAGLQLGYFMTRAGRNYAILDAGDAPGSFFATYPRHRTLISVNKPNVGSDDRELRLRMDWNSLLSDDPELLFTRYTDKYFPGADTLVDYLRDYAARFALPIHFNTRVTRIARMEEGGFDVTTERGDRWRCKRLVMATGVSQPYLPAVPGIELVEPYATMSVDPKDFLNQRVLILGKGNSAFETADNLVAHAAVIHVAGPSSLRLAWRTHYVGHLRAVNNNFLDTYQLKSQNAILDGNVKRIERRADGKLSVTFSFVRANEITKDIPYDRVIACTGFRFDSSIFADDCRPQLVHRDRFPAQDEQFQSVNVPGLYFAGTLMQVRDWKKSTCGFIHGFRYAVRALHHILEREARGGVWPSRALPSDPEALRDAVLARLNVSSGLWQQFGFLADTLVVDDEGATRYYEEVPIDYQATSDFKDAPLRFSVSLDYGPNHDKHDPFDVDIGRITQSEVANAHEGHYLHPIVRCYRRGELVGTHHVTENLENDWTGEATHRAPLRDFFARMLGRVAASASPATSAQAS